MKMETINPSETSVVIRPGRRYIAENGVLHSDCSANLKSLLASSLNAPSMPYNRVRRHRAEDARAPWYGERARRLHAFSAICSESRHANATRNCGVPEIRIVQELCPLAGKAPTGFISGWKCHHGTVRSRKSIGIIFIVLSSTSCYGDSFTF
jgi:hypothetical protein